MTERQDDNQPQSAESRSAGARVARFLGRHPVGVLQAIVFTLVAIVVFQNLEETKIDVLFWSVPAVPKLALIFLSMLVGAAAWEILRRALRRR